MLNLDRRIQYRHFDQTNIPSKELVGKVIQQAIDISPVDREVFSFKMDVWGPEHKEIKHQLCLEGVTNAVEDADGISMGNAEKYFHIKTKETWLNNLEIAYQTNPGGFNTQLEAPWLISLVENNAEGWYPPRKKGGDRRDLVSGNQRWKHYMNAGIFIHGLALAANDHGLDLAYCNCFSDICDNPIMEGYDKNNNFRTGGRENLNIVMMGLGYYDWSVAGKEGYDEHFTKTDQENILERRTGGRYDIVNHTRVGGYKDMKPPFEKIVTWR
tara:strand:+ start:162 stop:971 length:810 start_codon:yes stop_codon:yes gene_type:complete